jgi:uncharacterized protein with GYD domain
MSAVQEGMERFRAVRHEIEASVLSLFAASGARALRRADRRAGRRRRAGHVGGALTNVIRFG